MGLAVPDDKAGVSERTVGTCDGFQPLHARGTEPTNAQRGQAHPFKARTWHQYWFIDHRYLEKIDGVQYYSLCILEGYSRAFLSGVVLATQARGPVLKLLYETVVKWGAPGAIVSDSGGAFVSADYEACCERLGIRVEHIERRQSWQNLIETHFNIQRLIGDPQFARCSDEAGLAQAHAWFIERYNSSTHSAHLHRKDGRRTPGEVLSWVRGEPMSQRQVQRGFRELLWTRTLDRAGYALVQNYYLYGERAASRQRVCLWLWDDTLRIDCRDELLASYPCTYDPDQKELLTLSKNLRFIQHFAGEPAVLSSWSEQWPRITRLNRRNENVASPIAFCTAQRPLWAET
jgi:hypothetical protein